MRILKSLQPGFILFLLPFLASGVAQNSTLTANSPDSSHQNSVPAPPLSGTLRLLALDKNDQRVTDLKPSDLRLFADREELKILSVSSSASSPKTIGIFFDDSLARRYDPLVGKEMGFVIRFLQSVWRQQDVGFVVSFSRDAATDVPPTHDLSQIENAFPTILTRDFKNRAISLDYQRAGGHVNRLEFPPVTWEKILSSVPSAVRQRGPGEKVYVIVSDFFHPGSNDMNKSMSRAFLDQDARIFPLDMVEIEAGASPDLFLVPNVVGGTQDNIMRQAENDAKKAAEATGGDILIVKKEKDLIPAQMRLTSEVQSAYIVTYEPPPQSVPEKNLRVECNRPNVKLLYARE